jgi:hypothetical protein
MYVPSAETRTQKAELEQLTPTEYKAYVTRVGKVRLVTFRV